MNVGFKTGPRNWAEAKRLVADDGAALCEFWFEVEKASAYEDMTAWLTQHGVRIGLHHWGVAPGNIKTNLMTNNAAVRELTLRQMKQTIDIGATMNAAYVNIHPGARYLETMDFASGTQALVPASATPDAEATSLLLSGAQELAAYARERGVVLTIETLPGAENLEYERRRGWYDPGSAGLPDIEALAAAGLNIANDITHTSTCVIRRVTDRVQVWQDVLAFTRRVAAQTKLLHINTIVAPFDGTDSHNGLLEADWQAGAWPTRENIIEFLGIFRNRDDVCVIPEPQQHMTENYRVLRDLVRQTR